MAPKAPKAPRNRKAGTKPAGGTAVDVMASAAAAAQAGVSADNTEAPAGADPAAVPEAGAEGSPSASAGPSGEQSPAGVRAGGEPDGNDSQDGELFEQFSNGDDTYDGVRLLARLSEILTPGKGLSEEEVRQAFEAAKEAAKGGDGAEDAPAGRPASGWLVRIRSKREGFRRAGVAHPKAATDHPAERFDEAQIRALLREPVLSIVLVDPDGTEIQPPAELTE